MVSGATQPKVYDRDGHELGEFPKGDMYIRDTTNTKGHQKRCCGGQWHPDERCASSAALLCLHFLLIALCHRLLRGMTMRCWCKMTSLDITSVDSAAVLRTAM